MQPLAVGVTGALGSMGRMVCAALAADPEVRLAAAVDPFYADKQTAGERAGGYPPGVPHFLTLAEALAASQLDVLVDFTRPKAVFDNIVAALEAGVAAVVGTTGLSAEQLERIEECAREQGKAVFIAPNFALGAVLMMRFAAEAGRYFSSCEIIELHHERKLDAPSGTAQRTATLISEARAEAGGQPPIPIHSVRLPGLVAHQEVIFGGLGETLTIRHDSLSRECFMPGMLLAVKRVPQLQGLIVGLENIL